MPLPHIVRENRSTKDYSVQQSVGRKSTFHLLGLPVERGLSSSVVHNLNINVFNWGRRRAVVLTRNSSTRPGVNHLFERSSNLRELLRLSTSRAVDA